MFQNRNAKKVFNDNCIIVKGSFRERLVSHLDKRGYEVVECYQKDNGDFMIIKDKVSGSYRQKVVEKQDVIHTLRIFNVRY